MTIAMIVREQPMSAYLFTIYGTTMRYVAESSLLAAPANELLKHFRQNSTEEVAALTVCFQAVRDRAEVPLTLSSFARRLFIGTGSAVEGRPETGLPYEMIQDEGRLVADFHKVGVLVMDGVKGRADGYLIQPETSHSKLIEYLFHLVLIELLRHQGLYTIHAAALERHGRGVLIPGKSGSGKTTASISLLRSGYRYLSDDHPLIRDVGAHIEMLPFPAKINVTEATITFYPEVLHSPHLVLQSGSPKRSFRIEDLYSTSVGDCCQPALVLFPHVVDASHSQIEPLPKSRALEALLPHSLLVYNPEVARREFQVLAKLVQQADCYRVHLGRNVVDLPQLITPLLEQH